MRIALLAAAAIAIVAQPADAGVFGPKKKREPDPRFAPTVLAPLPVQPAPVANGAIFQANAGYAALTEGTRARRVGDPLTIVLVERTIATKSAASDLNSKGAFGVTPPVTGPLAVLDPGDLSVAGRRTFNGVGSAAQQNALAGEVSVTVAAVYPNGTMLVQGQKRLTLNRGDEFVQIRGIVRGIDVDPYNRVASNRVADAEIAYTGKGDVARASRQGWLSRFFQTISPF